MLVYCNVLLFGSNYYTKNSDDLTVDHCSTGSAVHAVHEYKNSVSVEVKLVNTLDLLVTVAKKSSNTY